MTDQFLKILDNEKRTSLKSALTMLALFAFAYFLAELTDEPLAGRVVLLAGASLFLGILGGLALAWRRTQQYNESLRESWNSWMRMSLSSTRIADVSRQVQEKGQRVPINGVLWGVLFLANAAAFAMLWFENANGYAASAVVTTVNGLVLGGIVGGAVWNLRWAAQFHKALDELMAEGELGVWGEL